MYAIGHLYCRLSVICCSDRWRAPLLPLTMIKWSMLQYRDDWQNNVIHIVCVHANKCIDAHWHAHICAVTTACIYVCAALHKRPTADIPSLMDGMEVCACMHMGVRVLVCCETCNTGSNEFRWLWPCLLFSITLSLSVGLHQATSDSFGSSSSLLRTHANQIPSKQISN